MMFALYERFIQQVKEEEIQRYNLKHQNYLLRANRIKKSNLVQQKQQSTNIEPKRKRVRDQIPREMVKQQSNINREVKTMTKVETQRILPTPPVIQQQELNQEIDLMKEIKQQPINRGEQRAIKTATEIPAEFDSTVKLEQCPQGCGRKFAPEALERHRKVCKKMEKKRTQFKVKVVNEEAENLARKTQKMKKNSEKEVKSQIPKWKKQSEQFRRAMNAMNTGEEEVDERIQCQHCLRKFDQKAVQKHVRICKNRRH